MERKQALQLVNDWTKNKNLVKHMLSVEAEMRALALHFGQDQDLWGVAGLLHDADYEQLGDKHPANTITELEKQGSDPCIIQAIKAHAWKYHPQAPEPATQMEWALYTCDELSGFIIACTLVRPDKKLSSVTVESILKKFPQKAFAAAVNRDQIKLCVEKLDIKLEQFVDICLKGMQKISKELKL